MNTARLKNIVILILLLANAFLLVLLFSRRAEENAAHERSVAQLTALLSADGIAFDSALLDGLPDTVLSVQPARDLAAEQALAEGIIGSVTSIDSGGGIYRYYSSDGLNSGSCLIRSGGALEAAVSRAVDDPAEFCADLCVPLGYRTFDLLSDGARTVVTASRFVGELEVCNASLIFTFSGSTLTTVTGTFLPPIDTSESGETALDAVTADRLRMLWLQPDYNAWRAYMVSRGVHPVVLSYLDDHRRQFYVFEKGKDGEALVTARGWEDLSVMLRMMEEFGYPVDLPFVAQYIQSAQVAREFISYYHQYSTIIASGLADAVFTNSLTEKQEKKLSEMSFPQKWALTAVVLTRLEQICADAKKGKADAAIRNVLHFDGAPQQEFLLGGITNTDAIALYIAEHGSDAYGASAEKVFFSDAKAPSVKKLKALLDAG